MIRLVMRFVLRLVRVSVGRVRVMSDRSLVDYCLHGVVVTDCTLRISCSVGVYICLSVRETDVNNPMNSADMRGVSTPVLPVTVFPVMEPVVTVVTLGTAYGCAVTESCCSPLCTTLTFLEVLREASKT